MKFHFLAKFYICYQNLSISHSIDFTEFQRSLYLTHLSNFITSLKFISVQFLNFGLMQKPYNSSSSILLITSLFNSNIFNSFSFGFSKQRSNGFFKLTQIKWRNLKWFMSKSSWILGGNFIRFCNSYFLPFSILKCFPTHSYHSF